MNRLAPLRRVSIAAVVLAFAGVACAAPERVHALEAGLWDEPVAAERQAQAALGQAEAQGDAARRYEAALRLAVAATGLEHASAARRAAAIVQAQVDARADDVARCLLAQVPVEADDAHASRMLLQLQRALDAARAAGTGWCVARLQLARGQILDRTLRLDGAVDALQEALRLFEADGDVASAASTQASLAWLYARMDESPDSLARAIEHGDAAVQTAERLGLRSLAAIAHHNVAGPLLRAERLLEAHNHLERALELARQIDDSVGGAYIARLQARVEERRDRPREALALFQQAQAVFAANGDVAMDLVCRIGTLRAQAALARWNDLDAGLAAVEPLLRRQGDAEARADFHHLAMQLKEARGDLPGALAEARAWVAAQRDAFGEQNRRAAAEARERHESARKDTENLRLRDQQHAGQAQQRLLLLTLLLALALVGVLLMHGLRQRRLRAWLRERAEQDDLTRLPNRRTMLEQAQRSLDEAARRGQPIAVALLDIDHFKRVNDRYGHQVGDAALRCFAAVCARTLRREDRLGRIGGEEFLGVFPGATAADLEAIFERIRGALRETPVPGMAADERLSFSMGAAFRRDSDAMNTLSRRADQALYEAKALGRDRLALAA